MKTATVGKDGEGAAHTGQWSAHRQVDGTLKVTPSHCDITASDILCEIDKQLVIRSEVATALIDPRTHREVTIGDATPLRELRVPGADRRSVSQGSGSRRATRFEIVLGALLIALGSGWFGASLYRYFDKPDEVIGQTAINTVVKRIIELESNGDPNAKNSRSSATGPGQFLSETWLDLIREYRPDLARGRSESETLELRREAKLAHEITTRSVERTAVMLRRRSLPVTAGTIYLAHFAGAAGAVAILSASENADAALVMASADATGRTKREQLIKANPFLEHFTVGDLKIWADRKMRSVGPSRTGVPAAGAKQ